eukprot:1160457-Pelagomonas_calceolata.AAC.5
MKQVADILNACMLARTRFQHVRMRTGQTKEIKIRLRSAYSKLSFLRYESVLGTMLHELVHNVRGPHDR